MPLVLAFATSACGVTVERPASGDTEWMSEAEFRDYAEQVLRRQNAVQSELMYLLPKLEDTAPARYERLIEAEERMLEACHPLVTHAVGRMRGAEIGFLDRLRLPSQTVACEQETIRVERRLED